MKARWFNREQLEELGITDVAPDGEYLVHNGRLIHAKSTSNSYLGFGFRNNGKYVILSAHRVVALWYFHEIPEGYDVDHIDHDGWNNRIENLRLLPSSENQRQQNKVSIRGTDASRKYSREYKARKRAEGRAQLNSGKLEDSPESEVYQA